jgi:hypothetical protein
MANSARADFIPTGTTVVINDPTNIVAFGTDTTASLDQLMDDIRDQDHDAIKELLSEGHLIPVKNGTQGRTIVVYQGNRLGEIVSKRTKSYTSTSRRF